LMRQAETTTPNPPKSRAGRGRSAGAFLELSPTTVTCVTSIPLRWCDTHSCPPRTCSLNDTF